MWLIPFAHTLWARTVCCVPAKLFNCLMESDKAPVADTASTLDVEQPKDLLRVRTAIFRVMLFAVG